MTIADEKYVALTTRRRSGQAVVTPVWIAPLGDGRAGFTTDATSGKVKRIRNNPAVTLQACNMRGVITPGTPVLPATASIAEGSDLVPVRRAIKTKYGLMVTLVSIPAAVKKLFGKPDNTVGVIVTFESGVDTPPPPV